MSDNTSTPAVKLPKGPLRYLSASSKRDIPSPPAPIFPNEEKQGGEGGEKQAVSTTQDSSSVTFNVFDLSSLGEKLKESDERREKAYKASNNIQRAIVAARVASDYANNEENEIQKEKELDTLVKETLNEFCNSTKNEMDGEHPIASTNELREANLSQRVEDYARFKAFRYFLNTGKLIPLKEYSSGNIGVVLSDEEYIGGACIGLANDLSRYAIGRATERDGASVEIARDVTDQIMGELIQFDFRNGPLRRKYDSVKYALKKLETILYELSVTSDGSIGTNAGENGNGASKADAVEPDNKRAKIMSDNGGGEDEEMKDADQASTIEVPPSDKMKDVQLSDDNGAVVSQRVDVSEMSEIRRRMELRDEMREKVIKRCRDGQKAAKQAIYALHRNDIKRAKKLINECDLVIAELLPTIEQEPFLRGGSFGCMLEEYAEAKLFFTWLQDHRVGNPSEYPTLEPQEYLGGLCDLTGEIGRVAVQHGAKRDSSKVKGCLEASWTILNELQLITIPYKLNKKVDPLKKSVEKLEQIMYELSLIQHGRNIPADSICEDGNNKNDDDQDE